MVLCLRGDWDAAAGLGGEAAEIADGKRISPAAARVATHHVRVVMPEKHDLLELAELEQQLDAGGPDVAVLLGLLVAPRVVGERRQCDAQADQRGGMTP
jgi:hypothetical protein